jgi:hypothetical protein
MLDVVTDIGPVVLIMGVAAVFAAMQWAGNRMH